MIDLRIRPVDEIYPALDGFSGINLFHTRPWHRVLESSFRWQVLACVGFRNDEPVVYFPFVRKRRLGRTINVCLPLSHRVGPVWASGVAPAPLDLRATLWPIEIHAEAEGDGLVSASAHQLSTLDLSRHADENALFKAMHKNNIQRKVKSARKAGVVVRESTADGDFQRFGHLQDLTRRRQGAPTYPGAFYSALASELGTRDQARVFLSEVEGRAVAGVVFLYHEDTAVYAYGASLPDRELWKIGVNQIAMWHALSSAHEQQKRIVDFGSSPNAQTALIEYKERFGAESQPLVHSFGSASGKPTDVSQDGPLSRLGGAVIRHLPVPAFRALSPLLLKTVL